MHSFMPWIMLIISMKIGFSTTQSPSELQKFLFKDYNPKVIPARHDGDKINIKISMIPLYLRQLDEEKGTMILDTWIFLTWNDSRLAWDKSSHGEIEGINIPSAEVWKPDIGVYNASPQKELFPQIFTNVIVYENGVILWVPPATIHSICQLDLQDYPYDTQTCKVTLGSWTYGSKQVDVKLSDNNINMTEFSNSNSEWDLLKASVKIEDKYYDCCPNEYYTNVQYNFIWKRRGSSVVAIANSVCCIAILLSLFMFCLPTDSNYKILLGVLAEALLCTAALYIGAAIDSAGARTKACHTIFPFMYFVGFLLAIELIVLNLARMTVPWNAPKVVISMKGICQPLKVLATQISGSKEGGEEEEIQPWNSLAIVIDKITLVAAIVIAIVLKTL